MSHAFALRVPRLLVSYWQHATAHSGVDWRRMAWFVDACEPQHYPQHFAFATSYIYWSDIGPPYSLHAYVNLIPGPSLHALQDNPEPLPYLRHSDPFTFNVELFVDITTPTGTTKTVTHSNFKCVSVQLYSHGQSLVQLMPWGKDNGFHLSNVIDSRRSTQHHAVLGACGTLLQVPGD